MEDLADDIDGDDYNGLPAYSHHGGIRHYDEGWENDTVTLPQCINLPSTYIKVILLKKSHCSTHPKT